MILEFILRQIANRTITTGEAYSTRHSEIRGIGSMAMLRMPTGRDGRMKCEISLSCLFFDILILEFKERYVDRLIHVYDTQMCQTSSLTAIDVRFKNTDPMRYMYDDVELRVINADKSKGYSKHPAYEAELTRLITDSRQPVYMSMDPCMPSKPAKKPNTTEVTFTACIISQKRRAKVVVKSIKPKAINVKKRQKV